MTSHFVHDASMVGAGVTTTTGVMLWFGENATAIGAITAILMLVLTGVFQYLNWKINQKRLDFDRRQFPNRESEK